MIFPKHLVSDSVLPDPCLPHITNPPFALVVSTGGDFHHEQGVLLGELVNNGRFGLIQTDDENGRFR